MMKGSDSNPGNLICKAVTNYDITNVVIGRRSLGSVERFFVGSSSKYELALVVLTPRYVVENAECNVIVVKKPFGAPEEHDQKTAVIQAEEGERLRREEEEGPAEVHESDLSAIKKAEEEERERRIKEDGEMLSKDSIDKLFSIYKFQEKLKIDQQ